jgi:adenylate cyclase
MLAKWHVLQALQGWAEDPRQAGQLGLARAHEALDREPDHPLALSIASLLGVHFGHDLQAARALAMKALDADPQETTAWMTLAGIDSYVAHGEESVAHARHAIELSPLDPCRFLFDLLLGAGQLAAGRAAEAIDTINASMRLNAVHAPTYRLATIANMLAGRPDAARKTAQGLIMLDPGFRVRNFAERYPGRDQPHAANYIRALQEAGLPM